MVLIPLLNNQVLEPEALSTMSRDAHDDERRHAEKDILDWDDELPESAYRGTCLKWILESVACPCSNNFEGGIHARTAGC